MVFQHIPARGTKNRRYQSSYLENIGSKTSPQPKPDGEHSSSENEDRPRKSGKQRFSCVEHFLQIAF